MQFGFSRITEAKDYILAAVLLILSASLLVGRSQGGLNSLRKISVTIYSYLEEPLSSIRVYRQALKTNTDLRRQNITLLDELNRLRSAKQRTDELRDLLNFSRESNLTLYPVQIVAKELNNANNTLTVDAGSKQGITQGMPMVSAHGLVGKVVLTAANFSQVMPFYNTLFRASAKLQKSNAYGIISWGGGDLLELNYIPQTIDVNPGEAVLTSGYSNQFPANIPIGEVVRTEPNKGKDTQRIFVRPFAELYTIAEGFIVTTPPDTAIKNLKENYRQLFK